MKQLLPLTILLILSACGGQKTPETEDENSLMSRFVTTLNIHESVERDNEGIITYKSVPWGGLVGSVKERNLPVDWTGYESITFEFATPTKVETQLLVSDKYKAFGKPGISELTCNFDGQDVSSIDQVTFQTVDSSTIAIKEIKLKPISGQWKTIPLRSIDCHFGDWQNGFVLKPELFQKMQLHKGDKLEFVYTTDTTNPDIANWLIKAVYNATDSTFEGNSDALNSWGCAPVGRKSTIYRIPLTTKDIVNLQERGAFVNGRYVNMTQCNLIQQEF